MRPRATKSARWALLVAIVAFATVTLGVSLDGRDPIERGQRAAQASPRGDREWINLDASLQLTDRSIVKQRVPNEPHRIPIGVLVGIATLTVAIAARRFLARWSRALNHASSWYHCERAPPAAA